MKGDWKMMSKFKKFIRFLRKNRSKSVTLITLGAIGVCFVLYQIAWLWELNFELSGSKSSKSVLMLERLKPRTVDPKNARLVKDKRTGKIVSLRGTRDADILRYLPNSRGKFMCLSTGVEITYDRVNDDFCDCTNDGSDEPGTNACNNGTFYCAKHTKNSPVRIKSKNVNDGVCDCCDGSDEWDTDVAILGFRPPPFSIIDCPKLC